MIIVILPPMRMILIALALGVAGQLSGQCDTVAKKSNTIMIDSVSQRQVAKQMVMKGYILLQQDSLYILTNMKTIPGKAYQLQIKALFIDGSVVFTAQGYASGIGTFDVSKLGMRGSPGLTCWCAFYDFVAAFGKPMTFSK